MRRHAKASSAGSTQGQASRRGHIFRGALVTRGVSRAGSGAPSSRRLALLTLATALSLTALAFGVAPAFAATVQTRPYESQLTEANGGPFANPYGLAVDPSDNLWVSDTGAAAVDKFDSTGAYLAQGSGFAGCGGSYIESLAYGTAADLLYVSDSCSDDVWGIEASSAFSGTDLNSGLGGGCCYIRVSVDNSGGATDGDLYVSSGGSVIRIDGSGNPANFSAAPQSYLEENRITGTPGHSFSGPGALATDSAGNLYVADNGNQEVDEFSPSGEFIRAFTGSFGSLSAVAVDPTNSHVLIGDSGQSVVHEFDSSGNFLFDFKGPGGSFNPQGIAVDSTGKVYVSDSSNAAVDAFGAPGSVTVPDETIGTASPVGFTTATLHGTVNPQGVPTSYHFEYRLQGSGGWGGLTPEEDAGEGSADVPVSAEVSGLQPGSTYEVRLVATNTEAGASSHSEVEEFATEAVTPPSLTTPIVSALTASSAHFEGEVNPGGTDPAFDTSWHFSCSPECPGLEGGEIPADEASHTVEADTTGLQPHTEYTVTLSAANAGGTAEASETFTTEAIAPVAITAFAAPRTTTTARLNGRINPENDPTTYYFQYGPTESYGALAPVSGDASAGSGNVAQVVSQDLTGLAPGSTYHYRLVAESAEGGTATGSDVAFTTRTSVPAPRGYELVNAPDKGNQGAYGYYEFDLAATSSFSMSGDGNTVLWRTFAGAPGGTSGANGLFVADRTATGWTSRSVLPPAKEQVGEGTKQFALQATSPDYTSFLFTATANHSLGAATETIVRQGPDGHQEILGVIPNPQGTGGGSTFDTSEDLAHVLFRSPETGSSEPNAIDVGTGAEEIVSLLPSGAQSCSAEFYPNRGPYHWASRADSSRVFFRSQDESCSGPVNLYVRNRDSEATTLIAPGAELVRAGIDGRTAIYQMEGNLYRYTEESGSDCLTCGVGPIDSKGTVVSPDLAYIYFASNHRLVPDEDEDGQSSLYVWHEGEVRYIAPIGVNFFSLNPDWALLGAGGRILAFLGNAAGTTSDDPGRRPQLYRYDDADRSIECVSCLHNGSKTPKGVFPFHALSADGGTMAFTTQSALVPGDVNNAIDVYEWRDGVVRLVTDGVSEWPDTGRPDVAAISDNGAAILFSTTGKVTGTEHDEMTNLYEARIGGGFPSPNPPAPCQEDACQGPLVSAPPSGTAGSESYVGPGNQNATFRKRHRHRRGHRSRRHQHRHHAAAIRGNR